MQKKHLSYQFTEKMTNTPLVSIITINYKQAEVTNQLLESLQKLHWQNIEIIVVDNASGEEDLNKLDTRWNKVSLIKSKSNLGFAGGNNLGIKQAKGDYILLLNNDTEVPPLFLEQMVELLESDPTIGAVSPKIKFFYDQQRIQYAGFTAMNPFTLRMNAIGSKQIDNGDYDEVKETHYAHGCSMMVPRKVIEKVGMMAEDYFLYYEEHDWCTKIKKAGYKIFYQPKSVVLHKESISVSKNSPMKTYYLNRNRILYMRRNLSWFNKLCSTLFLCFISIPKNIIAYLSRSEYDHLKAYSDAILWNLLGKKNQKWERK